MGFWDKLKKAPTAIVKAGKTVVDACDTGLKKVMGEAKRLENIDKYKDTVKQYEDQLDQSRDIVNRQIRKYNDTIPLINQKRRSEFKDILEALSGFLMQLGKLMQNKWQFSFELTIAEQLAFHEERTLSEYKDWIKQYEKTQNQVFDDCVKGIFVGVILENNKLNPEIVEKNNDIYLATDGLQKKYASIAEQWQDRTFIATTYLECIELIHETITEKIMPELELISAFLLAESVKNNVISDIPIENAKPLDISAIKGTIYGRHYTFVKNAFLFYVLSRQIYQSPILTRLTQTEQTANGYSHDKSLIAQQKEILQKQSNIIGADIMR